jgi:hypothetical protein
LEQLESVTIQKPSNLHNNLEQKAESVQGAAGTKKDVKVQIDSTEDQAITPDLAESCARRNKPSVERKMTAPPFNLWEGSCTLNMTNDLEEKLRNIEVEHVSDRQHVGERMNRLEESVALGKDYDDALGVLVGRMDRVIAISQERITRFDEAIQIIRENGDTRLKLMSQGRAGQANGCRTPTRHVVVLDSTRTRSRTRSDQPALLTSGDCWDRPALDDARPQHGRKHDALHAQTAAV